ncbi:hypothetical protein [uncultured Litoreibacter sp.]|uniref:hypothetical protein n=1 Tax=uncultured Litoreibacter sp. TaxID=1392394 RepID=UPI003458C103
MKLLRISSGMGFLSAGSATDVARCPPFVKRNGAEFHRNSAFKSSSRICLQTLPESLAPPNYNAQRRAIAEHNDLSAILNGRETTTLNFMVESLTADHPFHVADLATHNSAVYRCFAGEQVSEPLVRRYLRGQVAHGKSGGMNGVNSWLA